MEQWPPYNTLATTRPREFRVRVTQELSDELDRQNAAYQIGMDFLLRLDVARAMPIFRNYLMVTNDLVVHPDARDARRDTLSLYLVCT